MPIDLEYPLPGDVVGNVFHAGGTYDTTREKKEEEKKEKKKDKPEEQPVRFVLATGSIICTLFKSDKTVLGTPQVIDLTKMPEAGTWDVTFDTKDTNPYPDCYITAQLHVGISPYPEDRVEEIDVNPPANGAIEINI